MALKVARQLLVKGPGSTVQHPFTPKHTAAMQRRRQLAVQVSGHSLVTALCQPQLAPNIGVHLLEITGVYPRVPQKEALTGPGVALYNPDEVVMLCSGGVLDKLSSFQLTSHSAHCRKFQPQLLLVRL